MTGEIRIGTSGWQYDDWRGEVYPEDLPQRRWLEHYVTRFPTVEVNSTFYRLAKRSAVESWADTAPEDFEFVLKGSQFITHRLHLKDPDEAIARFYEPVEPVIPRTPVVLWQLRPNWKRNVERLDAFLSAVPDTTRHAVEFREASWFHEDVYEVLREHNAANVWLSSSLTEAHELEDTADFVYVRFHGLSEDAYRHDYTDDELAPWADRLAGVADSDRPAWVFFNNDYEGHAVTNGEQLADMLGDAARPWVGSTRGRVTRVSGA